jgi:3-oxoacyl-[acyl-carrier protein] reductase
MLRLQDRVSLVTGAGHGIGKGIAERFLDEGARVWICDIRGDRVPAAIAELERHGPVDGSVTDVSSRSDCQSMFDAIASKWGRVDVVVNNAGGSLQAPFLEIDDAAWMRDINLNLNGTFLCMQIGARMMVRQGSGGSIINISSTNGLRGQPGLAPYGAAKAGVINLSKSAALELGEYGIRVNALCPGTVLSTGQSDDREDTILTLLRSHTALKRLGTVPDISGVALFLASDDAAFVTGHALVVDGGLIARQLIDTYSARSAPSGSDGGLA